MLPGFANQTVTVLHPGTVTERGSTFRDWQTATSTTVEGCLVLPDSTSSDINAREQTAMVCKLYAPVAAQIVKGDRVVFDGTTYEVLGVPFKRYSPRGSVDHLSCRMQVWEG